jgi:hypothetical protein
MSADEPGTVLYDFRFSRGARRVLAALAETICTDEIRTRGLLEPVLDEVERMVRATAPLVRLGLRLGMWAFEWTALLVCGRRFSSLPAEKRAAWFRRWFSGHGIGGKFAFGIKGLIAFAYFEHPSLRDELHYHPDQWIAQVAKRRLEKYGDEVRAHDALVRAPDPLVPPEALARKVNS